MATKIQLRRDVAASWSSTNPTLAQGEPGVDLRKRKKQHADPRLPMGMGKRKDF